MKSISKNLQGILWSRKVDSLDFEKDKNYIIHQILAYGNLKQIKWLFKVFSKKKVIDAFSNSPKKTYTPSAFNFIKIAVLDLENKKLDPEDYVKTVF